MTDLSPETVGKLVEIDPDMAERDALIMEWMRSEMTTAELCLAAIKRGRDLAGGDRS